MLAYKTLEHLRAQCQSTSSAVIRIFLSHLNHSVISTQDILKTILYHLIVEDKILIPIVRELPECGKKMNRAITEQKLQYLLLNSQIQTLYLVVDGIDEWQEEEREWLLKALLRLTGTGKIRLLLSSRVLPHIGDLLTGVQKVMVNDNNTTDIEHYSKFQIDRLQKRFFISDVEGADILAAIQRSAKGSFLSSLQNSF